MNKDLIKTFTINWNNYEEVSKLGLIIKSRLGEINPYRISKTEKNKQILDACYKIFNSDIEFLYNNLNLDTKKEYYVYAHLDTSKKIQIDVNAKTTFGAIIGMDHIPFYIGKGIGNRCYDINRNENHRKVKQKIIGLNKEIKIIKLFENLTEKEALCIESKLIDIFGLIPFGGKLTNLDEGIFPEKRRNIYRKEFEFLSNYNKILR